MFGQPVLHNFLRLDATNGPLTGTLETQNLQPDTGLRDIGLETDRYRRMFGKLGIFVNSALDTDLVLPANADHGGLIFGSQSGPGTVRHTLNSGGAALMCGGRTATTAVGGQALLESIGPGSSALGTAYGVGATGDATINSGFSGAFANGYAYGLGTSLVQASGYGGVAFGYAGTRNATASATLRTAGLGPTVMGMAFGYIAGSVGLIEATGSGAFASGYAAAVTAHTASIRATGRGSFAHGYASTIGGNNATILASGHGSFAVGYGLAGTTIHATATNSAQFGPGINALADSLQVGAAGIRFKGTAGAPGALQNGDMWVNAGYIYMRSNGASIQVAGPGPLTN